MTLQPVLRLTDGTEYIDLLSGSDIHLDSWEPELTSDKTVFSDSPIGDERFMMYRKLGTAIESFNIYINGENQDAAIRRYRKIQAMLEQSKLYWTRPSYKDIDPVYIYARSATESTSRYAIVLDANMVTGINPYAQPFLKSDSATISATISVERGQWRSQPPGQVNTIPLSGVFTTGTALYVVTLNSDSDNITIGNHADIQTLPTGTGGFTIEGWFRVIGNGLTGASTTASLFDKQYLSGSPDTNYVLRIGGTDPAGNPTTVEGIMNVTSGIPATTVVPSSPIMDNAWHHIAMQYNNAASPREIDIFFDGLWQEPTSVQPTTETISLDTEDLVIGNAPDSVTTLALDGQVSWCRISATERYTYDIIPPGQGGTPAIKVPVQNVVPPLCSPPDLDANTKGQWHMDEGTGSTVDNETGNATLDGTLTGTIWDTTGACAGQLGEGEVDKAYLTNYRSGAYITDAYTFDSSLTSWSSNLIGSALPYNILPNPIQTSDAIYLGAAHANIDGIFANVIFDTDIVLDSATIVWEYYNGATWTALSSDVVIHDETNNFGVNGIKGVFFRLPSDWTSGNLNSIIGSGPSVTGMWLRGRVTVAPSITAVNLQQQNVQIYTANQGGVLLSSDSIDGDLGAASKITLEQKKGTIDHVLIGTKQRTANTTLFTPFINFDDTGYHNDPGITFTAGAFGSIGATSLWPTGRRATVTVSGSPVLAYTITLSGAIAKAYAGEHKVLLVAAKSSDTPSFTGLAYYALNGSDVTTDITNGTTTIDKWGITPYYQTYDLGTMLISEDPDKIGTIDLSIEIGGGTGGGSDIYLYQLILFPVDGEFYANIDNAIDYSVGRVIGWDGTHYLNGTESMVIDGITNPRRGAAAYALGGDGSSLGSYSLSSPTGVVLPKRDSILWVYAYTNNDDWGSTPAARFNTGPDTVVRADIGISDMYHALIGE